MAVNYQTLSIEKKCIDQPPLEEIAQVLNKGLKSNFDEVKVEVVDCPDLTKAPFKLLRPGLGGHPKIVEIGGVPYLLPLVQRDKVYDLARIVPLVDAKSAFIIGAGAGPFPHVGVNCEGVYNMVVENGRIEQQTRIGRLDPADDSVPLKDILPNTETRVALLANLFFSDGKPGKVLQVHAKKRIGPDDFVTSIRACLVAHFQSKTVGLGGAFLLKEGNKAKQHVMSDFSKTPINTEEELNSWLKFFNMSAPLVAVGTLINNDPGLDLRVQHFHSYSDHEAGHYHNDVTPETAEYLGYFNTGAEVYRVDKPTVTHNFGRD